MKARKFLIEKVIIEDATQEEIDSLIDNGFEFKHYSYYGEPVYEKYTSIEK